MYKELLGDRLRKAREEAGYTQAQISKLLDIKQSQLSKIENNKIEPNIETLGILIDFYAINADWLLGTGMRKNDQK